MARIASVSIIFVSIGSKYLIFSINFFYHKFNSRYKFTFQIK